MPSCGQGRPSLAPPFCARVAQWIEQRFPNSHLIFAHLCTSLQFKQLWICCFAPFCAILRHLAQKSDATLTQHNGPGRPGIQSRLGQIRQPPTPSSMVCLSGPCVRFEPTPRSFRASCPRLPGCRRAPTIFIVPNVRSEVWTARETSSAEGGRRFAWLAARRWRLRGPEQPRDGRQAVRSLNSRGFPGIIL